MNFTDAFFFFLRFAFPALGRRPVSRHALNLVSDFPWKTFPFLSACGEYLPFSLLLSMQGFFSWNRGVEFSFFLFL